VNYALCIFSAVLLILIFPRFDWTWLAPVALTPLLVACARQRSWRRRFLEGWSGGFVFWFGVCYWIQFVLEVHGGMGTWGGWGTFFLFAILKGLHMAVFAALAGFVIDRWWAIPAVAALWTGLERTHGPFGFAWLDLGNAGIDMPVVMRLAPFIGVYGLSFVFAMIACGLALVAIERPRRELAWLLVLPFIYLLPSPNVAPPTRQALVVQPNVDSEVEWTRLLLDETEMQLALLSRAHNVDLIIWPEMPVPLYVNDATFLRYAGQIAESARTYFLFGAIGRGKSNAPLNAAVMLDPSGHEIDEYDKIKLVPFGEFVPDVFSWVNRVTKEAGDFAAGNRVVIFPAGSERVGVFICYESAFPDLVRQFARDGAEVFVNLSNDGYFGTSAAHEQHLELVRMRAAENARWIVRATNDGITATVDPSGRVTQRLRAFRQLSDVMRYGTSGEQTLYTRHGDWFAWSCLVIGVLVCIFPSTRTNYAGSPAHRRL
jgi:apolipoprotein N-acyltransferase